MYQLIITSKNLKSLKKFILFCFHNKINCNLNANFCKKKRKKKIITVLKSPHVNKTAQTQLENRIFSIQIRLSTIHILNLFVLKKIKLKLFPEIKIKIKFVTNFKNHYQLKKKILNPQNFTINSFNYKQKKCFQKKNINYLKIFDCFGELNLIFNKI